MSAEQANGTAVEATPPRKQQVVFVLGGPGAGKGTQCTNVVRRLRGWATISAGDVLRECRRTDSESEEAEIIEKHISAGTIVPVEITIKLIKAKMEAISKAKKGRANKFLIDGFPRNKDNVSGWKKVCGDSTDLRGVLYFSVSDETCVKRVLERAEKSDEKRTDDTEEGIKKRLQTNKKECEPIVDMYEKEGKLVRISGEGKPNEVWKEVQKQIKAFEDAIRTEYPPPPRPQKKESEKAADAEAGGKDGEGKKRRKRGGRNRGKGNSEDGVTKETSTSTAEDAAPKKGKGKKAPANWIKVEEIDPNSRRCNFFAKVCGEPKQHEKLKEMFEVQVGDESASVTCILHKKRVEEVVKMGEILRFQNCVVKMRSNFIRVELDRWALLKKGTEEADTDAEKKTTSLKVPEIKAVNTGKNVSATEYEAVDPKSLDAMDGEGAAAGENKRKGRGKRGGKRGKKGAAAEPTSETAEKEDGEKKRRPRKRGIGKGGATSEAAIAKAEDKADDAAKKKQRGGREKQGTSPQVNRKEVDAEKGENDKKSRQRKRKGRGKRTSASSEEMASGVTASSAEPASGATTDEKPKRKGRGRRPRGPKPAESGEPNSDESEKKDPAAAPKKGKGKGKGGKGAKGKGKGKGAKGKGKAAKGKGKGKGGKGKGKKGTWVKEE
ncbi:unnamed protein product [Amoebophrya sp. A25]|nr:unnamed protein product [Amoebophrya sp. A25]|eukprot:GSA25T00012030001.1